MPSSFGPTAAQRLDAWTAKRVSLVRASRRDPGRCRSPALPQSVAFDLARSALVVVDMQNDFCHPEGWFAQKGIGDQGRRASPSR